MLFGHILTFLHFLGHPRLLGTLPAVSLDPKPLKIASNYVFGKVKNVKAKSVGKCCEMKRFKSRGVLKGLSFFKLKSIQMVQSVCFIPYFPKKSCRF